MLRYAMLCCGTLYILYYISPFANICTTNVSTREARGSPYYAQGGSKLDGEEAKP